MDYGKRLISAPDTIKRDVIDKLTYFMNFFIATIINSFNTEIARFPEN